MNFEVELEVAYSYMSCVLDYITLHYITLH